MKTFKDLTIGSEIYCVAHNSSLLETKYSSGHIVSTTTVSNLGLRDGGRLHINRRSGYHGEISEFEIPAEKIGDTSIETTKGIVFVDSELAHQFIRKTVLAAIKREENRIPEVKTSVENNLKEIRQRYWKYIK